MLGLKLIGVSKNSPKRSVNSPNWSLLGPGGRNKAAVIPKCTQYMMMSWHGSLFCSTGPLSGESTGLLRFTSKNKNKYPLYWSYVRRNPLVTGAFSSQRGGKADIWCFSLMWAWSAVEQIDKLPGISDAMAFTSCHCHDYLKCSKCNHTAWQLLNISQGLYLYVFYRIISIDSDECLRPSVDSTGYWQIRHIYCSWLN